MVGRLFSTLIVIAALCCPRALYAQFTEARNYTLAPVGLNELELDYDYARADASLDTSLEVVGAHLEQDEGTVSYLRTFGMLGHLAWAQVNVPFASVRGSVAGTDISGSRTGPGDSSLQLTTLLKGGEALSAAQFAAYEPATTVAVSVTVSAPSGQYDAQGLFNLGSNRWSFMPELAVSHPFGPDQTWEVDIYGNVYFFTDNTAYRGTQILRQEPLPGVEGYLSHDLTHSLWVSLDLRYAFGGETSVDGVNQNDAEKGLIAGTEVNWSPSSHHSFALLFAKTVLYRDAPSETRVALKYVYSWGAGSE